LLNCATHGEHGAQQVHKRRENDATITGGVKPQSDMDELNEKLQFVTDDLRP
jgi:hypothetical protein